MSPWESIGKSYGEAIAGVFPLHRALVFGISVLFSEASRQPSHTSIVKSILSYEATRLFFGRNSMVANMQVMSLLAGFMLVLVSWVATQLLINCLFSVVASVTKVWERADKIRRGFVPANEPISVPERQALIQFLDLSLSEPKKALQNLNAAVELILALSIVCMLTGLRGSRLDLLLFAIFLIGAVVVGAVSIHLFLADYFGLSLLRAELLGRKRPTPSSP